MIKILTVDQGFATFMHRHRADKVVSVLDMLRKGSHSDTFIPDNADFISCARDNARRIAFLPRKRLGRVPTWDPDKRMMIKPGRLLYKIIRPEIAHRLGITQQDIERFSHIYNAYAAPVDFEMVHGEDIAEWYHERHYARNSDNEFIGSLGESCMRYDSCEGFFDIYTENNKVCQLLLLKSGNDLVGRALVWKAYIMEGGNKVTKYVMDRIYYTEDWMVEKFKSYARSNNYWYKAEQCYDNNIFIDEKGDEYHHTVYIQLEYADFHSYPYVDTFYSLSKDYKLIASDSIYNCEMRDTGGHLSEGGAYCEWQEMHVESTVYSEWEDCNIDRDIACYLQDGEYCHQDNSVYCDQTDEYYHESQIGEYIVYDNYNDLYILQEDSVSLYTSGDTAHINDCVQLEPSIYGDGVFELTEETCEAYELYEIRSGWVHVLERDVINLDDIDDDLLEQHNIDVDKCYYSQTTLEEKYKTNTY